MNDAEAVMKGYAGDEEVGDRNSMPQPVMVGEISLQIEGSLEDVGGGGNELKCIAQPCLERVIVSRRARRVELFELADGAQEQASSELGELRGDGRFGPPDSRALVEQPAPQRHISSEAS